MACEKAAVDAEGATCEDARVRLDDAGAKVRVIFRETDDDDDGDKGDDADDDGDDENDDDEAVAVAADNADAVDEAEAEADAAEDASGFETRGGGLAVALELELILASELELGLEGSAAHGVADGDAALSVFSEMATAGTIVESGASVA